MATQVRAEWGRAVRAVPRPGSGSAAGSAAVCVVSRPGPASVTRQALRRLVFRPGSGSAAGSAANHAQFRRSTASATRSGRRGRPAVARGAGSVLRRLSRRLAGRLTKRRLPHLRQASDISAPAQGLTGVRCASAHWSGHVSVSSPKRWVTARAKEMSAHRSGQWTRHKTDTHPTPVLTRRTVSARPYGDLRR